MQTNPFSTRFFQPGAIPYAFLHGGGMEATIEKILASRRCGLVIGPHGSGKSTFVRSLSFELEQRLDGPVALVQLNSDGTPDRDAREATRTWTALGAVIVDGIELLSLWRRWRTVAHCRKRKVPMVGTAHRRLIGCHVVWETTMDATVEQWVMRRLLENHSEKVVREALQSEAWTTSRIRHGENLRESLFDMYDWWQAKHT